MLKTIAPNQPWAADVPGTVRGHTYGLLPKTFHGPSPDVGTRGGSVVGGGRGEQRIRGEFGPAGVWRPASGQWPARLLQG